MSVHVISIATLALLFVIGTTRSVNLGLLGFAAAFGVGLFVADLTPDDVMAGFPVDLFLILVGLTLFFGFAQINGSIDLLVGWIMRAVRGRASLTPWVFFVLAALLMSVGAIFAVAIVAPLAVPFARRHGLSQLMMGLMVVHGALAGAFSPISVYGVFVNNYLANEALPVEPLLLFVITLVFNVIIGVLIYFFLGGYKVKAGLAHGPVSDVDDLSSAAGGVVGLTGGSTGSNGSNGPTGSGGSGGSSGSNVAVTPRLTQDAPAASMLTARSPRPTPYQFVTLLALAGMAIGVVAFDLDMAFVTLALSAVLAIIHPKDAKAAMTKVAWPTAMLVAGMITYIAVMQAMGTIEFVSGAVTGIGVPLVAALIILYVAGITSALASSLATIGVAIALATPFLHAGSVSVTGFVAAVAIAATVVDVSPFSTQGALVLANVHEKERDVVYRQMLIYAGLVVAIGPLLAWLVVLVPTVF